MRRFPIEMTKGFGNNYLSWV